MMLLAYIKPQVPVQLKYAMHAPQHNYLINKTTWLWVHIWYFENLDDENTIFWFKNIVLSLYYTVRHCVSWMKCYYFICAKGILCIYAEDEKDESAKLYRILIRSLLNEIFCEIRLLYVNWKQTKRFRWTHSNTLMLRSHQHFARNIQLRISITSAQKYIYIE